MNNWKKVLSAILVVLMMIPVLSAAGESPEWVCPECGRTGNTGNYCGNCAHPSPAPGPEPEPEPVPESWPVKQLDGTVVKLKNKKINKKIIKRQAYLGPGIIYAGGGAFGPETKGLTLISLEGDYAFVGTGLRYVYFNISDLEEDAVLPEEEETPAAYPAVITEKTEPAYGPGRKYETLKKAETHYTKKKGKDGKTKTVAFTVQVPVELKKDTEVSVFFETDGWVFAEFRCTVGLVRAWIPSGKIAAKE